ncbi:MAG: hypothetical protein AB1567_04160 [bacterium]
MKLIYIGQGEEIQNPLIKGIIYRNIPFEVEETVGNKLLQYAGFEVVKEEAKKKVKEV